MTNPHPVPETLGAPSPTADEPAIQVQGLVKRYGEVEAVKGIDLEVRTGEIFGFLGPNGAGKTTTISILCTLLRPTAGRAAVAGFNVSVDPDAVRASIGLVFQDASLDSQLTARENLDFHGFLYDVPAVVRRERIPQVLEMVDLADRADSIVGTFSGGMKRRLEIARGVLHTPHVLFLDEPTVGLDPQTRRSIWAYLRDLRERERITIFMTTHYMDEAEYCDRIAIIDDGRIRAMGSPAELKATLGGDIVTIATPDTAVMASEIGHAFGLEATIAGPFVKVEVPDGAAFVPRLVREVDAPIESVGFRSPSLDDVFIGLTGHAIREDAGAGGGMPAFLRQRIFGGGR